MKDLKQQLHKFDELILDIANTINTLKAKRKSLEQQRQETLNEYVGCREGAKLWITANAAQEFIDREWGSTSAYDGWHEGDILIFKSYDEKIGSCSIQLPSKGGGTSVSIALVQEMRQAYLERKVS
jgi:hypothetical protein